MPPTIKLIVLLSGGGTTLENIFTHIEQHDLPARVDLVVASKDDAYGLQRARKHGVDTAVVRSRDFRKTLPSGKQAPDWPAMSNALNKVILPREPNLVCFAGFMCKYEIPAELVGKVMNVHPALIPAFCGKGMYGHRAHEAVVASGVKVTGCTVHFVNNEYDAGPIIIQRTCPVKADDTADTVAQRVMAEERIAYPEAIRLYAQGRLEIREGKVVVS